MAATYQMEWIYKTPNAIVFDSSRPYAKSSYLP